MSKIIVYPLAINTKLGNLKMINEVLIIDKEALVFTCSSKDNEYLAVKSDDNSESSEWLYLEGEHGDFNGFDEEDILSVFLESEYDSFKVTVYFDYSKDSLVEKLSDAGVVREWFKDE